MGLTEFRFFLFAGAVILLYYALPKKIQWIVLLVASLVFYATYGLEKLPFLFVSALIAYFAARQMDKVQQSEKKAAVAKKRCKRVLLLTVAGLVTLLLYAKIGTWVIQSVSAVLSWEAGSAMRAIVALGVSYYTFSLISYLADVYWRKDQAEQNYFRLLLFTIYFPKILQGPISRHKNLAPQLKEPHKFDYKEFCYGLQLMVWGYFKKMVIADRLAVLVNTVFNDPTSYSGSHFLVAACFASVQLYCDFSGCMDIAGGFSQILGLKLEANFEHPFFSKSASEFWRRWHITLGTWFKDYVYMPLLISPKLIGISKKLRQRFGVRAGKAVMTIVPLSIVWLLTGLWHSTGWNYVVWGVYWGTIIICSTVFAPEIKRLTEFLHINTEAGNWKVFQMVRTFALFTIGRILTAPGDLQISTQIFHKLIFDFQPAVLVDGTLYTLGLDRPNFILSIVCIFVLWSVGMVQEKGVCVRDKIAESNIVFRWAIYYIGFFSILILGMYGPGYDASSFVYMNF